jgi:uncharacterized lipoprotein YbaY
MIKIVNTELYIGEFVPDNILVKGIIVFEEHIKPISEATIHIRLEDVSLQDAPSKLIVEQVIRNVSYDNTDHQKIEFVVYGNIVDIRARYSISVHVDVDNDDRIGKGDFITMQSYPVLTQGYPDNLLVNVKEVK